MNDIKRIKTAELQSIGKKINNNNYIVFRDEMNPEDFFSEFSLTPATRIYPGGRIIVEIPICPECETPVSQAKEDICPCGFDWGVWVAERFGNIILPGEEHLTAEAEEAARLARSEAQRSG